MTDAPTFHTADVDLDREIDLLIGKIVRGEASEDDFKRYRALSQRLLHQLQPSWVSRALNRQRERKHA